MTELGIELNDTSTELGIELDNLGADYNGLSNKPQINGTTLQGNKTGSQLGLANASDVYTKVEADTLLNAKADKSTTYTKSEADTLLNAKADKSTTYTKTETDTLLNAKVDKVNGKSLSTNDYTNEDKAKVQSAVQPSAISDMATKTWVNAQNFITNAVNNLLNYFTKTEVNTLLGGKQNTLVSGTNIKTINNQSVLGSGDIQVGGDVQSVNGKTGVVVLDAEDVGALPSTTAIPTKTSDLDNDSGFITNSVNNLTNYRLASAQDVIDLGLQTDIDNIESLIPSQATSSNKLADKNFVNSSIATSTATFRGTSATGLTEQQFIAWANTLTHDDNDYVFWNTTDTDGNVQFKRYKYDGTQWLYEYTLNNSSFTANQWATIQSGLSASDKTKLDGIESGAEVNVLEGVQIDGSDLTITDKKVNIPIASATELGTLKQANLFNLDTQGRPYAYTIPYNTYSVYSDGGVIGKGTLENVLDNETVRFDKATNRSDSEKAQARANIDTLGSKDSEIAPAIEKNYELIETITLTEDVLNIIRDNINYQSLIISIETAIASASSNIIGYINGYYACYFTNIINTTKQWGYAKFSVDGGMLDCKSTPSLGGPNAYSLLYTVNGTFDKQASNIFYFRLQSTNASVLIPTGTIIKIYAR